MAAHPLPVGELEHVVAQLGSGHGGPRSMVDVERCDRYVPRSCAVMHTRARTLLFTHVITCTMLSHVAGSAM